MLLKQTRGRRAAGAANLVKGSAPKRGDRQICAQRSSSMRLSAAQRSTHRENPVGGPCPARFERRIIGVGAKLRALETENGFELIVDDTPGRSYFRASIRCGRDSPAAIER